MTAKLVYPHSWILVYSNRTIDIAGPHIQVLDNSTGNVLFSTSTFSAEDKESVLNSGPVRCAAVDREFRYLLTAGEDKLLKVWEIEGLKILSQRELPKKPTAVAFTADAQTLLVSDKFGDVFSYPFIHIPLTVKQKKDALSSHENPSGGKLILGHASPLNAFLLTHDERHIVSADRDEHIRISCYPKGYNIEMYCLGHRKFVSAIHIPKSNPSTLISGGGDPCLKVWDWMTGKVKYELPVWDAVEPFIVVRALKRKRGATDDDGDEPPEGARVKKSKGKKRKGKAKRDQAMEDDEEEEREVENDTPIVESVVEEEPPQPEKVLVIHRIESVESDMGTYIIFSVVGNTSLFTFGYKSDVSTGDIRHFDFERPVLDFSIAHDGLIYATLDGQWSGEFEEPTPSSRESVRMVRTLRLVSGELSEDVITQRALIDSLNLTSLLEAAVDDLKKLDLYSELTSMPKNSSDPEPETSPSGFGIDAAKESTSAAIPIGAPELSSSTTAAKGSRPKAELSKKEIGRMKTKQAVMAKAQEMDVASSGKRDPSTKEFEEDDADNEPKVKRAKSDPAEDVDMSSV